MHLLSFLQSLLTLVEGWHGYAQLIAMDMRLMPNDTQVVVLMHEAILDLGLLAIMVLHGLTLSLSTTLTYWPAAYRPVHNPHHGYLLWIWLLL